jgi:histone deacetylase 1/2
MTLNSEFAMTDIGDLHYFLGIVVSHTSSGMFLSQQKYAAEILDRDGMSSSMSSSTPVDTVPKIATHHLLSCLQPHGVS